MSKRAGRRATCGKQYEFDEECKIERCPSASAIAQAGCQANETDIGCGSHTVTNFHPFWIS